MHVKRIQHQWSHVRWTVCALSAMALLLSAVGTTHAAEPAAEPSANATPPTGVAAVRDYIKAHPVDKKKLSWKQNLKKPTQVSFDASKKYYWILKTNVGSIKVLLKPETAPMHVTSTIYLTELGYYDETPFHRVIPGFMAQGGDPTGTGHGGPGYKYSGEFDSSVRHDRPGILSMANSGPGTDGSQFFLTFVPTPHLNGKHTIFGEVVEGKGTLKELEKYGSRPRGTTKKDLLIERATIQVE